MRTHIYTAQPCRLVEAVAFRPTACFIPAQAIALGSSPSLLLQANGMPHKAGSAGMRDQMMMNRAFSATDGFWAMNPGRLPWAGMNDAFSVSNVPTKVLHSCQKNSVLPPFRSGGCRGA